MRRQPTRAALGMLLFVLMALVATAQNVPTPVGTLAGTVLDAQGKPVADASVTIQTSDGQKPHATRTNTEGRFQFERWATGQHDIRAYAQGVFSDWDKRVLIRSKKTTLVVLRLPPAAK